MRELFVACMMFLSFSLAAQPDLTVRATVGILLTAGKELSEGYRVGLALEPGLDLDLNDKVGLGAAVVGNGYINNFSDEAKDYLIMYGPLFTITYKGFHIKNTGLHPVVGIGYLWGQDFLVSNGTPNGDRERIPLLCSNGLYWRIGVSIHATQKIDVVLTYNVHRPMTTITEEAQNSFSSYNVNSPLYGSIINFTPHQMSFDTFMIALTLRL